MAEHHRRSRRDASAGTEIGTHAEPRLHDILEQRKGVLQKNIKTFVDLGAALLVIVAAIFGASGKKALAQRVVMRRARRVPPCVQTPAHPSRKAREGWDAATV